MKKCFINSLTHAIVAGSRPAAGEAALTSFISQRLMQMLRPVYFGGIRV